MIINIDERHMYDSKSEESLQKDVVKYLINSEESVPGFA